MANRIKIKGVFLITGSILIGIILITQSCSTTKVISQYDCDTFANNTVYKKTTWSYAWGLVQPKDINPRCDPRFNHLNKVVVKTNLGFAILSTVTLGIVIPQHVEWCCAPYSPPTDSLGSRP
ncbi:hypothetical protein [Agriterribacter sp.]|uniref:hypothetical protein n=1 Tax=Agriterribacter sp. TaxID=2821509 RepID=UPI002C5FFB5C|nr:hypothetical protein [Agriterribacter sp.]HRO48096.1 hypothetical protein [Agriterribacter sp.]HRQ19208.1 hypothetical protein [Agriterribacter sp.]